LNPGFLVADLESDFSDLDLRFGILSLKLGFFGSFGIFLSHSYLPPESY
jgi:hypothetical protein